MQIIERGSAGGLFKMRDIQFLFLNEAGTVGRLTYTRMRRRDCVGVRSKRRIESEAGVKSVTSQL